MQERSSSEDTARGETTFRTAVLRAELGVVRERRKQVGIATDAIDEALRTSSPEESGRSSGGGGGGDAPVSSFFSRMTGRRRRTEAGSEPIEPSTALGLTGLALSGGGVRSASFNLGVLQILAERGLLRDIDYLSTVSGGGYIGSTLSTVLRSPGVRLDRHFPFLHRWGEREKGAFRHLRNCANYLQPGGLLEKLRIPSLMARGVFSNLILLLPYILFAAGITYLAHNATGHSFFEEIRDESYDHSGFYTSIAWLVVAVGFLLHPRTQRASVWSWLALAWKRLSRWARTRVPVLKRWPPSGDPPITMSRLHGRSLHEKIFGALLLVAVVVTFVEAQPYLIHLLARLETTATVLGIAAAVVGVLTFVLLLIVAASLARASAPWAGRAALVGFGLTGPALLWLIYAGICVWSPFNRQRVEEWDASYGEPVKAALLELIDWTRGLLAGYTGYDLTEPVLLLAAGCLALLVGKVLIDVNDTSLNSFYRDRLSRAYLFYVDPEGGVIQDRPVRANGQWLPPPDELKLSELNEGGSTAPYHLLNATLNVQRSRVRTARNRKADFFILSKEYTGGPLTGYCRTRELERVDSRLNLGTATAISGAAAAPSIATHQARTLVFFLALLNVRLGYWLINPSEVAKLAASPWVRPTPRVGPLYFLRELMGQLDEQSKNVYLSDGGHIENLGVFELLRRRCRRIIVCDAGSDPEVRFGALSRLIRLARVDLGCNIEIELDKLRLNEDGISGGHCALGKIRYDNAELGELLYVKLSVTGDESETIREYRARHPRFPYEPTTNQFFTEAQFEAYRHLGWHIAKELLDRALGSRKVGARVDSLEELFTGLGYSLDPRADQASGDLDLYRELAAIEARFSHGALAGYTRETYPELPRLAAAVGDGQGDLEASRQMMHLCAQQLQFMMRVFVAKSLADPLRRVRRENQGWIALFRRWASAPTFQRHWLLHLARLDGRFLRFCARVLGLELEVGWHPVEPTESGRSTLLVSVRGAAASSRLPIGYLERLGEGPRLVVDERYFRDSLVETFRAAAARELGCDPIEASSRRLDFEELAAS